MVLPVPNPTKSFWIEAAESHLRNFRSTEVLPAETDVVVIGSGYSGATFAYWLHKFTQHSPRQPKVVMLEARDICGCATGRNGTCSPPLVCESSRFQPMLTRLHLD
jgi:ribulose 1,5-bisphosphate synthetase/thiazole synthase